MLKEIIQKFLGNYKWFCADFETLLSEMLNMKFG